MNGELSKYLRTKVLARFESSLPYFLTMPIGNSAVAFFRQIVLNVVQWHSPARLR